MGSRGKVRVGRRIGAALARPSDRRHLMIVHSYYPVGETRVQRQALALTDAGYDVDVICLRDTGEPDTETAEGVRVYRVPVRRHKGSGTAVQLLEYLAFLLMATIRLIALRRRRYGTVQVHNLPDFLVFAALPARLWGARVILDLHDLMPELFAGKFETNLDNWKVRFVRVMERISTRFTDHVVTVTDEWRQTLIGRGVPPEKVSVVMNLADPRVFFPRAAPGHFGIHLIYHGTFTHRYGVDVAVAAVDRARRRIPDVHLSLLGAGETRDDLIAMVEQLDLESHVAISAAMVPTEDLPSLIAEADIGLVPNRSNAFTDGILPTKLLEYVAMGIPAVVSRTPGVAAYFDDDMVRFVEPGDAASLADAIVEMAEHRDQRAAQVEAANAFNSKWNWDEHATEYVALVDRLGHPDG